MAVNKVILVGRLGQDVELRTTSTNSVVGSVGMCTPERYKNAKDEWDERPEWHNLVFFGKGAELAKRITQKGVEIYVEGKLKTSKYIDQQGISRQRTDVIVGHFHVFSSGEGGKGKKAKGNPKPDRSGEEKFDW